MFVRTLPQLKLDIIGFEKDFADTGFSFGVGVFVGMVFWMMDGMVVFETGV